MHEPSRNLFSFHIAGFQFHDGALVLNELKAGTRSSSCPNRTTRTTRGGRLQVQGRDARLRARRPERSALGHDALWPRGRVRVPRAAGCPERSPWHQVRAGVFVTDKR